MRAAVKRTGTRVERGARGNQLKKAVGRAAGRMVELLEERQLLAAYHVNFTAGPAGTPVTNPPVDVAGYMTDIGTAYGLRTDRGQPTSTYGWVDYASGNPASNEANGRRRTNIAGAGDEQHVSFNHMMKPSNTDQTGWRSWEIQIPNGQNRSAGH